MWTQQFTQGDLWCDIWTYQFIDVFVTWFMVFSVTYYYELRDAIVVDKVHVYFTK